MAMLQLSKLKFAVPVEAQAQKYVDTLDIDQAAHRLYMGDNWSGGVDVFDISSPTPTYLKTIRTRGNLFGVAVAKEVDKVFVGLANSFVGVIDIAAGSPTEDTFVARVDTNGNGAADLIDWDPVHRKLYVANRHAVNGVDDGFISAIDGVTNEVVARIEHLGRTLEQPRFNPTDGFVYVTGAGDNVLHQIDPATDRLIATFPIGDDCHPNGLAINPTTNQALFACNNRDRNHTVIWDLTTQAVASVIEECGAGDGAIYDPIANKYLFAASGFRDGPVMGVFDGTTAALIATVPTERGASWAAYDQTHNVVYAPAYEDGKPALLSFAMP
ncbi:MAG: YncE family protein [Chloroflexota bacterium]